MSFQSPAEARKKYAEEQEQRKEEYAKQNRLPEGEDNPGRITSVGEELSRKKNEMYVVTIKTKGNPDENGKRKNIDIKKSMCKHLDFHMDEFYEMIELAGFDLKKIQSQDDMDEIIDIINEKMPECTFAVKHQKDSQYNNYEFQTISNIAPEELSVKAEGLKGDKAEGKSDSEKGSGYTSADIKEMEKDDLVEVAEELNITLKGKTKSKMQKEIIAHLEENADETTADDSDGSAVFPKEDM